MIVDASALLAVLLDEPEAPAFVEALYAAERPLLFKGNDFRHTDIATAV